MRKSDIRKQMDALVAGNVRKGETTAQTELRLARENNPEYDRLYNDMCRSDPEAPTIAKAETERERAERIVVRNGRLRGMEGPDSLVLSKVLAEDPDYHSIVVGASATKTVPPPDPTVPRPGEDTSTAAGSVAYYKRLNGD